MTWWRVQRFDEAKEEWISTEPTKDPQIAVSFAQELTNIGDKARIQYLDHSWGGWREDDEWQAEGEGQ